MNGRARDRRRVAGQRGRRRGEKAHPHNTETRGDDLQSRVARWRNERTTARNEDNSKRVRQRNGIGRAAAGLAPVQVDTPKAAAMASGVERTGAADNSGGSNKSSGRVSS